MLLVVTRTDAQLQATAIATSLATTRLSPAAAGEVLTLQRAAWVSEARANETFEIPPLTESLETVSAGLGRPDSFHWGYRDAGGRLLGMVRTTPTGRPGEVELGRLGVAPDILGTGVGSALLTLGEARLPASVTRLSLITGSRSVSNLRFYAAHGWTLEPDAPRPADTVAFAKPRTVASDRGVGPGVITADGSPVELYAAFVTQGEPHLIASLLPAGAAILELGCGTGRITDPLARAGFEVVGLDESPDMLAHLAAATPVLGAIAGFDAGRRFDAVIAASHLLNSTSASFRADLLDTVARNLAPGGVAVFQWHTPRWQDELYVGLSAGGQIGEIESSLLVTNAGTGYVGATVGYRWGDRAWIQEFLAERIGEDELESMLGAHGLRLDGWLKPNKSWFAARLA